MIAALENLKYAAREERDDYSSQWHIKVPFGKIVL